MIDRLEQRLERRDGEENVKKDDIVKSKTSGRLYAIDHVVHSSRGVDGEDVFACYMLSAYDGMPIGSMVWIAKSEIEERRDA